MQTTHKTVRYYIDREADTPIIRTVPVSRPVANAPATHQKAGTTGKTPGRRHGTRHRLNSLVQAGVRKYRHRDS